MKISKYIIFLLIVAISCSKPEEDTPVNPPVSTKPLITLQQMTPEVINQFESVTFFIQYLDGDGNIGDEDADAHALQILDTRDSILHTFHVPPQSPIPGIAISSVLEVTLNNLILLDQDNESESVVFNIRLRDRAMNWSETIQSPALTVNK